MSRRNATAGVELGGTKCVCTLARSPDEVIEQVTIPTTAPEATLEGIAAVLERWRGAHDVRALGIGSFGPIDLDRSSPTYGFITTTPKPGWTGTDVVGPLRRAIGVPAAFDTDVNAAALAELKWGAGRGLGDLAYVTVGTGVGVGLIVNGETVHGFAHPEVGHILVARRPGDDWPGSCPFHGHCVEGLASGTALKARLGDALGSIGADHPVWDSVAWALAQMCHILALTTAPQLIVIGGGVIEKQPHLLARIGQMLVESIAGYVALPAGRPYVQPPGLGRMAGPLGSIALALHAAEAAYPSREPGS